MSEAPQASLPVRLFRSPRAWILGLGLVLLLRFPAKFILEPPFLMDFEVFRFTALRVTNGQSASLYEPTTSERMIFKYAPCWAVILAPLAWLSTHAGGVLWTFLNVCWLVLTCRLADRISRLAGIRAPPFLAIPVVLLLVRPVTAEFLLGQADVLWGVLLTAFLYSHLSNQKWRAALWLALAISLKLPALLWLPYLMLRRDVSTVLRASLMFLGLNAAAAAVLLPGDPFSLFTAWRTALSSNAMTYAFDISNQSLLALMGRLLRSDGHGLNLVALPDHSVVAVTTVLQCILLVPLLLAGIRRAATVTRVAIDGAMISILAVLFSPSGWLATYTILLYPLFLALGLACSRPALLRRPAFLTGAALVATCSFLTNAKAWRWLHMTQWKGETYVYLVFMTPTGLGLALAWCLWVQRHHLDAEARGT